LVTPEIRLSLVSFRFHHVISEARSVAVENAFNGDGIDRIRMETSTPQ